MGYHVALVDHGISWAAYLSDNDENGIEFFVDRRSAVNGRESWQGKSVPLRFCDDQSAELVTHSNHPRENETGPPFGGISLSAGEVRMTSSKPPPAR